MSLFFIFIVISIIAVIIEIILPTMFCINFAFSGIITSIVSLYWNNELGLTVLFIVLSVLSIVFLKPILSNLLSHDNKTDFNGQYTGKIAKVLSKITNTEGSVTIYDERWEARLLDSTQTEIPEGSDVRIVRTKGTILYVEKI